MLRTALEDTDASVREAAPCTCPLGASDLRPQLGRVLPIQTPEFELRGSRIDGARNQRSQCAQRQFCSEDKRFRAAAAAGLTALGPSAAIAVESSRMCW